MGPQSRCDHARHQAYHTLQVEVGWVGKARLATAEPNFPGGGARVAFVQGGTKIGSPMARAPVQLSQGGSLVA